MDTETENKQLIALEKASQASSDPKVIEQVAREHKEHPLPKFRKEDFFWLATFLIAIAACLGLQFFFENSNFVQEEKTREQIQNYLHGGVLVGFVLLLAKIVEVFVIRRVKNSASRFNLKRVLKLVAALVVVFIAISILFVNWYTAVVSLGLISLILGFALQTPISSFIGWVYILARAPYRVGDRIKIGEARGDVLDVSYLDTTIWEIGGEYLSTDHPSGRIIKFPNSTVFNKPVFNYSWPLFPFVWNEIKFQLAYESDLEFVSATIQEIVEKELGESMMVKVKAFREILAKTPIHDLEVRERPVVFFRASENTWLEVIVRYVVQPKESGRVKANLLKKLLARLNAEPERVLFPKGNMR